MSDEHKVSPRLRFVVYVDPKPKLRPRFNTVSKRVYTPGKVTSYQNEVRDQVVRAYGYDAEYPIFPKGSALAVDVDFVTKLPKSHKGSRIKSPMKMHWRDNGDDIDNLAKSVLDGLNGIIWEDDRQITEMRMRKLWASREKRPGEDVSGCGNVDHRPRVCIAVRVVGDEPKELCDVSNKSASEYWLKD